MEAGQHQQGGPSQCQHRSVGVVLKVGSRKSALALIQTNLVIERLKKFYENNDGQQQFEFEVVAMSTTGDNILDKPLPQIGTKSLFTRELELALLNGSVDFIVHSLKDLPTSLPHGCTIGAIMKRDSSEDAIVLKKSLRTSGLNPIEILFGGQSTSHHYKIGTSSQRRIAMIKRCNQNLECVDIRGNLNTRIAKLDNDEGDYDAIVLATAGLSRMSWTNRVSCTLNQDFDKRLVDWCYAVGQGAIAVECRSDDKHILDMLQPIVDLKTTYETIAERSLMRRLEGGCSVPLGVRSTWSKDNNNLKLDGIVLSVDGKTVVRATGTAVLKQNSGSLVSEDGDSESFFTDITLPGKTASKNYVKQNVNDCSNLGIEVANKMIDLGCLQLMGRK